jgi:nucleoside-diphosphate-sugar epimerase
VSVVVVGRGFLGRAVAAALGPAGRLVGHAAAVEPLILDGVASVVWAGRHPALGTSDWRIEEDLEPGLARRAAGRGIAFTSLGTRKVYAPSPNPLREEDPLGPTDLYGRQKLAVEERLAAIPGLLLTRLRIGNVFGYERTPGRSSFLTRLLATLAAEGEVRLDVAPEVVRDFLPVEAAAAWIARLAQDPPGGVLNLGSGVGLALGRVAGAVVEGFGRGRIVVESRDERDGFVLDVGRLRRRLPEARIGADAVLAACREVGRRLAAEARLVGSGAGP